MVTFRSRTINNKILTSVPQYSFWMQWPVLKSKNGDNCSLHHSGNERQWSVNDFWSCILGNLGCHRLQIVITGVLAYFIGKTGSDTLPAPASN